MTTKRLQEVIQLNNEGVNLLCSPILSHSNLAMQCFSQAINVAFSLTPNGGGNQRSHMDSRNADADEWNLFSSATVPIVFPEHHDIFYFFDQGIYIQPDLPLAHKECTEEDALQLLTAILLLNTALGCCQIAYAHLFQQQREKANRIFSKALHLYHSVEELAQNFDSLAKPSYNSFLFFRLVALNNYSWLCLQMGMHAECRKAQSIIPSHVESGDWSLPRGAMVFIEELYLNSKMLAMTDLFSALPASAA